MTLSYSVLQNDTEIAVQELELLTSLSDPHKLNAQDTYDRKRNPKKN